MRYLMLLIVLTAIPALAGCPDTSKRMDEFVERSAPFRIAPECPVCSGPGDISGDYLLALSTTLAPDKPILADASIAVGADGMITFDLDVLQADDRTTAGGSLISASAEVDSTGAFFVDFGVVAVPGAGNPITGSDIVTSLQLCGCTSDIAKVCGGAFGIISSPIDFDIAGSTWGTVPNDLNAEPVLGCK